jgi:hypothetical protein
MKRLVAVVALAAILLAGWAWHALDRLADARAGQVEAAAATQLTTVTAPRLLPARTGQEAQGMLARALGDAASAAGVRLSLSPIPPRLDGLASTRIEALGTEDKLRAFADAAEAPPSPLRLVSWSITGDGTGGLRLSAEAAAAWQSRGGAGAVRLGDAAPAPRSLARTLFAVDQVQDARPSADAPPELVGIAGRLPNDAVALVRLPDGTTRDIRIGETTNGWRLTTIAADRAGFSKGTRQREAVLPARE